MTWLRRPPLAAALILVSGCSWITVQAPPSGAVRRDDRLSCTTSVAAPVTDTVVGGLALGAGGLGVAGGIAGLSCDPATCWIQEPLALTYLGMGIVLLGVAAVEGFSAAHGYVATAGCRELRDAQLACVSGVEQSCRALEARGGPPAR